MTATSAMRRESAKDGVEQEDGEDHGDGTGYECGGSTGETRPSSERGAGLAAHPVAWSTTKAVKGAPFLGVTSNESPQ